MRNDLRSYYEEEARLRLRVSREQSGRRTGLRDEVLALLRREGRQSVVDFGAGPGTDGRAFHAAGHLYIGVDLALGNGRLAAEAGLTVVQGSIAAPPLRPGSFDAGWSMSTLMHIPEVDVTATLAAMIRPLRSGAPLVIGLWGGELGEVDESGLDGRSRFFSLRSFAHNRQLLATCGEVEHATVWPVGPEGWEYHVFIVRVGE